MKVSFENLKCHFQFEREGKKNTRYTTLGLEKVGRKIHLRSYDFICEVRYTKNVIKNEPIEGGNENESKR